LDIIGTDILEITMDTELLCKDCKHSQYRGWQIGMAQYKYYCRLSYKETSTIENNRVTGPKVVKPEMQMCATWRIGKGLINPDRCGEEGRLWQPKHKKDLFKYIKIIDKQIDN